MTRHILDKRDGAEGSNRVPREFARTERQQGIAVRSAGAKAMQKAPHEPAGDAPPRVGEFVRRDRAAE